MRLEKHASKTKVEVSANFTGRMWWPQDRIEFADCKIYEKTNERYTTQNQIVSLRDALLKAQDSGDFQSLSFLDTVEVFVSRTVNYVDPKTRQIVKSVTRTRCILVKPDNPEYSDLFVH